MKRPARVRYVPLAALLAACLAAAPAAAQLSLGAGLQIKTGRYGKAESTVETSIPLRAAWRADRWRLQADLPLLTRVEGLASALAREEVEEEEVGVLVPARSRSQSGAGDLTLSAWYWLPRPATARTELALGARLKTPVAAAERCLLTNGATDLSLEARLSRPLGAVDAAATVGWTRRGDPLRRDAECRPIGGRTDLRNPLYLSLGAELPLGRGLALAAEYEYRQRLRAGADPKSEAQLGLVIGGGAREVSAYVLTGFGNASPDFGAGVRARWRF